MLKEQTQLFLPEIEVDTAPFHQAHTLFDEITVDGVSIAVTPVFSCYWYFAAERQKIFKKRVFGANDPIFTDDPILATYRFTNAYRASDRVSQYLISNVIYREDLPSDDRNIFFRTMLFKLFNKIETWEALEKEFGAIIFEEFSIEDADKFLSKRQDEGVRNYSAAYIMPSAGSAFGHQRKHSNHLKLLQWMVDEKFPAKLSNCASMKDAYELMLSAPSLGPFLAFQFATDLNYSPLTTFSEMEFVVAGPGAHDGISKCFKHTKSLSAERIIRHMAENQQQYFEKMSLDFEDLWGRPLQLVDCQNLFCEISKYSRVSHPDLPGVSGRTRIKQKFSPAGRPQLPWYPPDWKLNEKIAEVSVPRQRP